MGGLMSGNWRQERTRRNLKVFLAEVLQLEKLVLHVFVCASEIYTMKLHMMVHFVENTRGFGKKPVIDSFLYERCHFYIKIVYQDSSKSGASRMQATVTWM